MLPMFGRMRRNVECRVNKMGKNLPGREDEQVQSYGDVKEQNMSGGHRVSMIGAQSGERVQKERHKTRWGKQGTPGFEGSV